jgi:hypothetical protein
VSLLEARRAVDTRGARAVVSAKTKYWLAVAAVSLLSFIMALCYAYVEYMQ